MKNDTISRRAAIKAIDDLPNCYNGYSDTYDKAYIIGVLEELPTIDVPDRKVGKWTPVSEGLPEASVDVLVCNDDQKQAVAIMQTQDFYGYPMKEWNIKYCLYDCDVWDEDENGKIVAWMPLPEPWKGGAG